MKLVFCTDIEIENDKELMAKLGEAMSFVLPYLVDTIRKQHNFGYKTYYETIREYLESAGISLDNKEVSIIRKELHSKE